MEIANTVAHGGFFDHPRARFLYDRDSRSSGWDEHGRLVCARAPTFDARIDRAVAFDRLYDFGFWISVKVVAMK